MSGGSQRFLGRFAADRKGFQLVIGFWERIRLLGVGRRTITTSAICGAGQRQDSGRLIDLVVMNRPISSKGGCPWYPTPFHHSCSS